MYRFRSSDALLGKHNELINQEIYFPSIDELNDPMEGFKYLFFDGDSIVWKNLLSHYIICFDHLFILAYIVNDNTEFSENDIPIWKTIEDLETNEYRLIINEILNRFFSEKVVSDLLEYFESRNTKIHQNEVIGQLTKLHLLVLYHFLNVYSEKGYIIKGQIKEPDREKLSKYFSTWNKNQLHQITDSHAVDTLFEVQKTIIDEIKLSFAIEHLANPVQQRKWFLVNAFPEAYLNKIQELVYPQVYVSCFMSECLDPAIWGYYGSGHTGVALKFKTTIDNNKDNLFLHESSGHLNPITPGQKKFAFYKINYGNSFQEIDFFTSLGRLPMGKLMKYWYQDSNGKTSKCYEALTNEEKWRNHYWDKFYNIYCRKLDSWNKENEYRLIMADTLKNRLDKGQRKFRYNFYDLEAIVFGKKTKLKDKIEIISIIKQKCEAIHRTDFKFYQADILPNSGKMVMPELEVL